MKKTIFKGSGVAIVTPMHEDYTVNYEELGKLIDFQIENKTDAIIICGTTGEASALTHEEHIGCIDFAVKHTKGRVPVIAGAGSNDTAYAIELSREAKASGADALLHVTPYYNKTTQKGLIRHFNMVADATDLPVILYNVPGRTGLNITPETYFELSKHPNIAATKEAGSNISAAIKTRDLCGDNLGLYVGNDDEITAFLSIGALGVISVLANVMPKETHDICSLFFENKVMQSAEMQIKYSSLISALFCEVNPIPVKEAVNLLGYNAGPCKPPLCEMEDKNREFLIAQLKKNGISVHCQ